MGDDFAAFVVVEADRAGGRPDADLCEAIRRVNGLENATVLYDPDGRLEALGLDGRHHHYVLRRGAVLEFEDSFRDTTFVPVLERLLAD